MARLTPAGAVHGVHSAPAVGTLTDIDFLAWIATAEPGAALEYHRGFLCVDCAELVTKLEAGDRKRLLTLPGIVDQVITMAEIKGEDGQLQRGFVCQTLNPWGYPAKDRSGRLELLEVPHLGRLMDKIRGPLVPVEQRLTYQPPQLPAPSPAQAAPTDTPSS